MFVFLFAALNGAGMSRAVADSVAPVGFRLVGALGLAFFAVFAVWGLRLLGPHEITIDLAQGLYRIRSGLPGVSWFEGKTSDIDGLAMKSLPVKNHKEFRLFLVWKDPHRPSFPLLSFPYKQVATSVAQEVSSRTGLPVWDEM